MSIAVKALILLVIFSIDSLKVLIHNKVINIKCLEDKKRGTDIVQRIGTPEDGYYILAERIVLKCFQPIYTSQYFYSDPNKIKRRIAKRRIAFSKGRICQSWCDLSNINHDRVIKAIEKYNKKYLRDLKVCVNI